MDSCRFTNRRVLAFFQNQKMSESTLAFLRHISYCQPRHIVSCFPTRMRQPRCLICRFFRAKTSSHVLVMHKPRS